MSKNINKTINQITPIIRMVKHFNKNKKINNSLTTILQFLYASKNIMNIMNLMNLNRI